MVEIKGPISGYLYPHKAILVELENLEKLSAALLTRNDALQEFEERINFMKLFFTAHEDGEEVALYPAAERLRKGLSKSFEWDRHINEYYFQAISAAIAEYKTSENLQTAAVKLAQATAALRAYLGAHEVKEDEILLPLLDAELTPPEQGKVIGAAMSKFPPTSVEDVEKFLIKRLSQLERISFLKVIKQGAPTETFKAITVWVKEVVSPEEFKELTAKMPELK
jgi:hypothetical protein